MKKWPFVTVGICCILLLVLRIPSCSSAMYDFMHQLHELRSIALRYAHNRAFSSVMQQNDHLHKQIEQLSVRIDHLQYLERDNARLRALCSVKALESTRLVGARVLENNIYECKQSITIDVGREDDINEGDVVVCTTGTASSIGATADKNTVLVGIVRRAYAHTSEVLLAIDKTFSVPVQFEDVEKNALLRGNNDSYVIAMQHEDYVIAHGTHALTSGYGRVFPAGIYVGAACVSGTYVSVVSPVSFSSLSYVCVIVVGR